MANADRAQLHQVLVGSFPGLPDLELMSGLYLGLRLDQISASAAVPDVVTALIGWAEPRGRIAELIEAARDADPANPGLQALAKQQVSAADERAVPLNALTRIVSRSEFSRGDEIRHREDLRTKVAPASPMTTEILQRIALRSVEFFNTEEWRNTMAARERAVCRIEFPEHAGQATGFLVAPDLVMTNYHVLEPFIEAARPPSEIRCRFGYQVRAGTTKPAPGAAHALADDWLVASSAIDQLDYAIVRLKEPAAADADGTPRQPLKPVRYTFETGEAIFIIQHPKTAPLKVASGGVVKSESRRVFYLAATLRGSSGSPCFSDTWDLVALHRGSEDVSNVGVPFTAILDDLEARQLGGLLAA